MSRAHYRMTRSSRSSRPRILRRGPRPTACGVGSLNQLFGLMAALRAAGVDVPGQMSVVSFDEDECLAFLEVPVTSVAMPLAELGGAAVDQLIARIERQPAGDVMIREPMKLLTRRSVARPWRGRTGSQWGVHSVLTHWIRDFTASIQLMPSLRERWGPSRRRDRGPRR